MARTPLLGHAGRISRLTSAFTAFLAVLAVLLPAQAMAVNPEQTVGGAGSKWFSGSLLQQSGLNCTIIGGSYSETMVSAIAGFGGTPGIPKVGDTYYASLLVSIPGNPCGSGSSIVGTDLVLPRGTTVDTSKPIRCFGQSRTASTFGELTGGNWGPFLGSSGPYCPASVGSSLTGTSGAVGVGFRPLANGQLYELFVPIKSSQTLIGAAHNPVDEIRWVLSTSGTYSQIGSTSVWTTVVPAGTPSGPFIYFARNPSVVPFWNNAEPDPSKRNQAEWFANLYSAGQAGTLCWDLYTGPTATGVPVATCADLGTNWNGTVTTASDTWQVNGGGPNGGFVPFSYSFPNFTYTIRWRFQPNVGPLVTNTITFTTLAGPDGDADGVPDLSDACPTTKGTLPNGCQPGVQDDPDGDGLFGPNDKCPNDNGGTSLDGCPVKPAEQTTVTPADQQQQQVKPPDQQQTNPPALTLTGGLGAIKGNAIKRSALAKGYPISVTCGLDSDVAATLTVSSSVAKKLKLKVKKGQKSVPIGSAKGKCTAAKGGTLKLKLASSAASKVKKSRKGFPASLGLEFTRAGTAPVKISKSLKLT